LFQKNFDWQLDIYQTAALAAPKQPGAPMKD